MTAEPADGGSATSVRLRGYLRKAMGELLTARQRIAVFEAADDEPIAVIGMACRFPGNADTPERLWDLVAAGRDVIGPVPSDRGWAPREVTSSGSGQPGQPAMGGFLADLACFDAGFFGISPREALAMDPQQRLMLELAWEAAERAGIAPGSLRGSRTGVFTGVTLTDYADLLRDTRTDTGAYLLTGNAASVVSGRVAYALGLRGPAVTVDAACASSLVSVHLAAQSLRAGESSLAIAGGVTVMATPLTIVEFARMNGLSARGRCQAFADSADGIVWAEGAGVLLVERLSDALASRRQILGLIRATAVNQDGASSTLSTPNGPAQQRVIQAALTAAGLTAADIDAVEAHGTGTPLGDPIEAHALLAAYGQRPADQPLWLGSVKSNIGHTQAAAGIAGVIKMIMAMRERTLPATLHADTPSAHVDWSSGNISLLTSPRPWPELGRPRRSAVSSFGISGTNAHVILEQAPAAGTRQGTLTAQAPPAPGLMPLVVSGRGAAGLRGQSSRLADFLQAPGPLDLPAAARALVTARTHLDHRAVAIGAERKGIAAALRAVAAGEESADAVAGAVMAGAEHVVFVFPGQGGQWAGMARDLLASCPVFAAEISRCAEALAPHVEWSLAELLAGTADPALWDRVDVIQPALFAMMVALSGVWRSLGVVPAAVVGHSQGEFAAAVAGGAMSLADGARLVARRSAALRKLAGTGGMVSAQMPAAAARDVLAGLPGSLSLAAVNGPAAVVVSGPPDALGEFRAACSARGAQTRMIPVDYASHGSAVGVLRERLLTDLDGLAAGPGEAPFYSTVRAGLVPAGDLTAEYWYSNLRETVQFQETVEALLNDGFRAFVECSPHPVLVPALADIADEAGTGPIVATGTLRREMGGVGQVLRSAAELFVRGAAVDWASLVAGADETQAASRLPTYAFQRERYWPASGMLHAEMAPAGPGASGHPVLGAAQAAGPGGDDVVLTGRLAMADQPWLGDHRVNGSALFPGVGFMELALRAGSETGCGRVAELTLYQPLMLPDDYTAQIRVVVSGDGPERAARIYSRSADHGGGEWILHADGLLAREGDERDPAGVAGGREAWPPAAAEAVPVEGIYGRGGYDYGPAFRGVRAAWRRGAQVFTEVELAAGIPDGGFGIHPALFDIALHGAILLDEDMPTMLPFAWSGVRLAAVGARSLRATITRLGPQTLSLTATDTTGRLVVSVETLALWPASADLTRRASADSAYEVGWAKLADGRPGGAEVTDVIEVPSRAGGDVAAAIERVLPRLRGWLSAGAPASARLAIVTRQAVAVQPADRAAADPVAAAVRGFARSVQAEHPDRLLLLDLGPETSDENIGALLALTAGYSEPELAVREGTVYGRRLFRARRGIILPSAETGWRVDARSAGQFDTITAVPSADATRPLSEREVRVGLRAAGVNSRDALIALGSYPDAAPMGSEGAGVVTEVGPLVGRVAVGDMVAGVFEGAFAPVAVADERALLRVPAGWSAWQAAGVPIAFLTAYYGLAELSGLRQGQALLVHEAADDVGMAAIQLARHLGARVFATASPARWPALQAAGLPADHIASSRDTSFEHRFLAATDGRGVDVILSGLAGKYVDASLRLLPRGGRFLDMALSDLRDPAQVGRDHPGVAYHAFRPAELGLDHMAAMMDKLSSMFGAGALKPLPVTGWPLADAPAAVRGLATGQNTGKYVLSCPRRIRSGGTVVVTGGTGLVGGLVARHLAAQYGVTSMLLLSRTGPDSPGARQLQADLQAAGTRAAVLACDVGDREALARALATIPAQHPLTGIVHAAAVLDDCTFESVDPARLRGVLRAKAEAAWHLHELTKDLDLEMFILFSSLAGTVSAPGQASYAAANAYLDALASWRQEQGMSGTAIAWGRWETASELTRNLSHADLARMSRGGMLGLSAEQGMALFDLAQDIPSAAVAAVRLDLTAMASGPYPPLFASLVPQAGAPARQVPTNAGPAGSSWKRQLAGRSARERLTAATDLICSQVAVVLGYQKASDIDSARTFRDLGFDSLSSVELRNQLSNASGARITPTAVFEHPTPQALARHLIDQLSGGGHEGPAAPGPGSMDRLLRGAVESGQFDRFLAATAQLAAFSPVLAEPGPPRSPVTLSAGENGQPTVYCLPSLFGKSSYEAFWRLAETLSGKLEVRVLTHPGFLDGEALPASAAAVLRTHADTIIRHQQPGSPFVLVGYSSGAAVARALAGQLLSSRLAPLGLILLDSFSLGSDGLAAITPLIKELIARNEQLGDLGANWALAMSRYGSFDWPAPPDTALPVLLVRATQQAGGAPPAARGLDPQEDDVRAEIVDLNADHLSLLQEKAPETAKAIVAWLQKLKGLRLSGEFPRDPVEQIPLSRLYEVIGPLLKFRPGAAPDPTQHDGLKAYRAAMTP